MREIKFRGKCVQTSKYAGEWVYGGCAQPESDSKRKDEWLIVKYLGGNNTMTFHVIPKTVGQFTGLLDKNGREIYEGDILDTPISDGMIVVFGTGSFHINTISGASHYFDAWMDKIDEFEVVGNIHDNTELLKGGDQ